MSIRIFSTGVRSGEFIAGASGQKQSAGCVMQVRGEYPPSVKGVEELDDTTLRDAFNHYAFFGDMDVEERKAWLWEHATKHRDLYMDDVDLSLRFVKLGGFFTQQLSQEQIDTLLRGNPKDPEGYWPIGEVFEMFPRKPGSRGVRGKHTLIFRPNNWSLMQSEANVEGFTGWYFNLDTLTLKEGSVKKPAKGYMRVFKTERSKLAKEYAAVSAKRREAAPTWESIVALVGDYGPTMERVKTLIGWFSPALHKSLIQKLIRTHCKRVEYAGETYDAGSVLLTSLALLLLHPGAFVPNIQRFVTGAESFFKRLGVSISEDSFLEEQGLLGLLYICAQIAQQDRSWQPTDTILMHVFRAALLAQREPRIFDYDHRNFTGNIKKWDVLSFCYLVLDETRSFESDVNMLGSIAERGGVARKPIYDVPLMEVMPLIHCVDQHTYTEIAHYLPYTGKPFADVFHDIWNLCTGVNPRVAKYQEWKEEMARDIRQAQRQLWISKIYAPQPRPASKETMTFTYHLPLEWLAGLIGPMEIHVGASTALVVLRCDDIYAYTAIKRPSREMKVPELTEEEKSAAIAKAVKLLQSGVILEHVPTTLPQFKGATVYLKGSVDSIDEPPEYYIHMEAKRSPSKKPSPGKCVIPAGAVKWSDAVNLSYVLPLHEKTTPSIDDALLYTGEGMMKGADETFEELLKGTNGAVLRRLATYLEDSRTMIELYHIGRDGTGVDYAVLPEDTGVFHLLCYICCLYPAALVKTAANFQVKNGPLMWTLRDRIQKALRASVPEVKRDAWELPAVDERKMWEHQRNIDESLQTRHLAGKRTHLIWVPVGLGKSMNVTSFIRWLIERKEMPEYCAWILPPSAVDSIEKELDKAHLPHQTLDMRSKSKIRALKPGMVNLILHDHMRLHGLDEQLKTLAGEGRLLPVFDEFHKMMNATLRTSIALEILRLAPIAIGLSGTIIKSADISDIQDWLRAVVEFEVTKENAWVALGALISKKITTGVVVERIEIEAKMADPAAYYATVPKGLGGTAAHLHFKEALTLSYAACIRELVDQTLFYVKAGEGVFVVTKDAAQQQLVRDRLLAGGVKHIHLITKNTPITLTPDMTSDIQVVITTKQHVEGYSLTKMRILITTVILSNQTTRDQWSGRINRIGQVSPMVREITTHAGILSYILKRYDKARSLAEAVKGFAADIGVADIAELRAELL